MGGKTKKTERVGRENGRKKREIKQWKKVGGNQRN